MPSRRSDVDFRPNRLAEALRRRAAGRPLLDLTRSNPTRANIPYDEARVLSALADRRALSYEPAPFGLASAREAAARALSVRGVSLDASQIVLTASTSESYSFLFKLLCDPGDNVLVPRPSYPLFEHLARYEGVEIRQYALDYDGAWHVNFDSVGAFRDERTRAIVVVTPNNPTGSFLKRDELDRLQALGLPIVSDEVFAAYSLSEDEHRVRSALEAREALVFALDGLSKFAALPQMKLGWIGVGGPSSAVGDALARLELLADSFLSTSAPVLHAAAAMLEASAPSRSAILERTKRNLTSLVTSAKNTALTPLVPEGGWHAPLRFPAIRSEEAWVLGLLEDADVLVQPGFFYDFVTEPYAILSLLTPEEEFSSGVNRIVEYVARG